MGVSWLLRYILEHRDECVSYVDLIEIAQQQDGIEILVDYYNFQQILIENFWKSLSGCCGNPFVRILGGEYGAIDAYITKLLNDLKSFKISLVFFVDGAKGSSKIGKQMKFETWKSRHEKDVETLREFISALTGHKSMNDIPMTTNMRPVCLEMQIFESIKQCECELVLCPTGEADVAIARNFEKRTKAFCVLSNDTDFCVFKGCKVIFRDLFDTSNELNFGSIQNWMPSKPSRLFCGVVSSNSVCRMLRLPDEEQLVDLSIVSGNDFTSHFMKNLRYKLGIRERGILPIAEWVRRNRNVENNPEFSWEMRNDRNLAEAVERSRDFYNKVLSPDQEAYKGQMSYIIDEGVLQGEFPPSFMSMHLNFYWHRMLLEECQRGQPTIEMLLAGLRSYLYRMVLTRRDAYVTEHGRGPFVDFVSGQVYPATDLRLLTVDHMTKDKIFANLRTFSSIMLHQEPNCELKFIDKYGRKRGFKLLILRYMLVLNHRQNLDISLDEFLALISMVFCRVDEPWYCGLVLMPTTRCVTILNWFQDIYRHAYLFLGKALRLTHEFPIPKDIISGSVFTAFYMNNCHYDMLRGPGRFPREWLQRISEDQSRPLKELEHVIGYLVSGIFQYGRR